MSNKGTYSIGGGQTLPRYLSISQLLDQTLLIRFTFWHFGVLMGLVDICRISLKHLRVKSGSSCKRSGSFGMRELNFRRECYS